MNHKSGSESRLTRLEEELAFQEQKLEGLNSALLMQQKQLDKMEMELFRLAARLQNALEALEEAGREQTDEKPPHYL